MNQPKKRTAKVIVDHDMRLLPAVLLTLLLALSLNLNLFPRVIANRGGEAFESRREAAGGPEYLIIEAAQHFLQANGTFQQFLRQYEASELKGPDFAGMGEKLDLAIDGMKQAGAFYTDLVDTAQQISYNSEAVKKLKNFDYSSFQVRNRLNGEIFKKISQRLEKGDVHGVFEVLKVNTLQLVERMNHLKGDILRDSMPPVKRIWRTNQLLLETALFGQYAAEVFDAAFGAVKRR